MPNWDDRQIQLRKSFFDEYKKRLELNPKKEISQHIPPTPYREFTPCLKWLRGNKQDLRMVYEFRRFPEGELEKVKCPCWICQMES